MFLIPQYFSAGWVIGGEDKFILRFRSSDGGGAIKELSTEGELVSSSGG
jgi:hypothetical protein